MVIRYVLARPSAGSCTLATLGYPSVNWAAFPAGLRRRGVCSKSKFAGIRQNPAAFINLKLSLSRIKKLLNSA